MREIKFRAWWEGVKQMVYFDKPEFAYAKDGRLGMFIPSLGDHIFLGNSIDMQFTGLKDMNGKEIYESDIVEYSFPVSENKSEVGKAEVIYENGAYFLDEWYISYMDKIKVVGNIHENQT